MKNYAARMADRLEEHFLLECTANVVYPDRYDYSPTPPSRYEPGNTWFMVANYTVALCVIALAILLLKGLGLI